MELETSDLKSLFLVLLSIILSLLFIGFIVIYIYYKMNKRSQLSVLNGREKYLALQNECSSSSDTESESEESCFVTTKTNTK